MQEPYTYHAEREKNQMNMTCRAESAEVLVKIWVFSMVSVSKLHRTPQHSIGTAATHSNGNSSSNTHTTHMMTHRGSRRKERRGQEALFGRWMDAKKEPGSKWSCLLLRIVLQDAMREVTKIYTTLKLRVFVDDLTALVKGKNKEEAEMAKKVMKKLKEEVEKKGIKLSVTENGKEGKSKMIASCGFLKNELSQFSKEEGVTLADSVETLGVDLRTRVKRLGAKEKARRKKCKVRLMSRSCYVQARCQQGLGSACGWDVSH